MADADILAQMKAPGGASPPPGIGSSAPSSAAPLSSPMSTPEPKMGTREGAMVNLGMAIDLIEQSLPGLGSESPEGQKAVAALRALSGILGPGKQKTNELQPAEIQNLISSLPQGMQPPAGGTPGASGSSPAGGSPMPPPNAAPAPGAQPQMPM